MQPSDRHDPAACARISGMLSLIADKWTLLIIRALGRGPMRFNVLRREIGDISQKMLASTLRELERDGFVARRVIPSTPPGVEYALTELGQDLKAPVCALASWTEAHGAQIEAARAAYSLRNPAG